MAMTRRITERDTRVYKFLCSFWAEHGFAPTMREIADVEETSTSAVSHTLNKLEEIGAVRKLEGYQRSYIPARAKITYSPPPVISLPQVGTLLNQL